MREALVAADHDAKHTRVYTLLILLGVLVVYTLFALSTSLVDRDEPRFSRAAVEMLESGDYLVPHFNTELRPDKPPLMYWLMNGPLRIFGQSELAVRLPSMISMVLSVWLAGCIARRMFGQGIQHSTMLIFATMLLPIYMGTAATADATLLACIMLAQYALVCIWMDKSRWRYLFLFFIAVTLGQLAKGPVALAVPLLTIAGAKLFYGWLQAKSQTATPSPKVSGWWIACLSILSGLFFLAWMIPADQAVGGEMWKRMAGEHLFDRILRPAEGHGGTGILGYLVVLPLYIPLLIGLIFPWTIHLPGAASALIRGSVGDIRSRTWLMGWIVPNFVMFSLIATKLPHYILPIFPAVAIMVAAMLQAHHRRQLQSRDHDWVRGGIWFFIPVAGTFVVGMCVISWLLSITLGVICTILALGLIVVVFFAVRWQLRETIVQVQRLLVCAVVGGFVWISFGVMPGLETYIEPAPKLANMIREAHPERAVPIYWAGYGEPSFVFYINLPHDHAVQPLLGGEEGWRAWSQQRSAAYLVTTKRHVTRFGTALDPDNTRVLGTILSWNYSSEGEQQNLVVIERHGNSVEMDN